MPGSRPAESYHIHVMFFIPDAPGASPHDPAANNPNNRKNAELLRATFMQHFNISECPPSSRGHDPTVLCAFEVDPATGGQPAPAKQPFVTPEFAFFVPVDRYTESVGWMMLNRGVFDVFVHPNTCGWSCAVQDHLLSSVWMGTPWQVKFRLPSGQQVIPSNQLAVSAAAPLASPPATPASSPLETASSVPATLQCSAGVPCGFAWGLVVGAMLPLALRVACIAWDAQKGGAPLNLRSVLAMDAKPPRGRTDPLAADDCATQVNRA